MRQDCVHHFDAEVGDPHPLFEKKNLMIYSVCSMLNLIDVLFALLGQLHRALFCSNIQLLHTTLSVYVIFSWPWDADLNNSGMEMW